jgi:predicted CXXCH cytochrome family protein
LSCHDGVTAPDVYSSSHSTTWIGQLGSSQLGSGPLSSHPIGNQYPLANSKYHGIAGVQADGRVKLPGGRVQCTSCHDPHNTERHPSMLVKSNNRSALCLSCHRL